MKNLYFVGDDGVLQTFDVISEDKQFASFVCGDEECDILIRSHDNNYYLTRQAEYSPSISSAFQKQLMKLSVKQSEIQNRLNRVNKAFNAFLAS